MVSKELQNTFNELMAPVKSFRIFALEDLIKTGDAPEILPFLNDLKQNETDRECLMLIDQAIAAVSNRLKGEKHSASDIKTKEGFLAFWENADDNDRLNLLSDLPARLPKDIRAIGPEILTQSESPIVKSRVIRVFCRAWPKDQINMITSELFSGSLTLQLAVLRTLVHISPESLLNDLPKLLYSPDPQIKALAVRALAKIDQEEALKYLQASLLSSKQEDRVAGLQNCLFLPFDVIKTSLLKFFAAETNPELLTRAGWIIEMNPDIRVPFHLFEIAERSTARKASLVKKILNEAVLLLQKSGILGSNFKQYTIELKEWIAQKNSLRFVRQVVSYLDVDEIPSNLNERIKAAVKQKVVYDSFSKALSWPVSDRVKHHIESYLNTNEQNEDIQSSEGSPNDSFTFSDFVSRSDYDKLLVVSSLDEAILDAFGHNFADFILHKDYSEEVRAAVISRFTSFKLRGLEDAAVKLVTNPCVSLATAAVEYLGAVDPESVFPYLGRCFNVADVRMKSAALGILKTFDFNQALSSLKAMLNSPDPAQQGMALQCIDQFDFDLIRDLLTEYLCHCTTESLAESGLCHFAANPSADNIYSLYKIEKMHLGKIAEQAKKLRESCPEPTKQEISNYTEEKAEPAEVSVPAKQNKAEHAESILKQRLNAEIEKKRSKRPAYAFKEEEPEVTSKAQLTAAYYFLKDWFGRRSKVVLLVIVAVAAFLAWDLFVPKSSSKQRVSSGAIISQKIVREGVVESIKGSSFTFYTPQKERFVFDPVQDGYRLPDKNAILRISLVPFRKYSNGVYTARIRSMRVIKEYSKEISGSGNG